MIGLVMLALLILVLVFHVEFDTMKKRILDKLDEMKLEQASRSCGDDYYGI